MGQEQRGEQETAHLRQIAAEIGFADYERLVLEAHFEDAESLIARLKASTTSSTQDQET